MSISMPTIREFLKDDVPAVTRLLATCAHSTWNKEVVQQCLLPQYRSWVIVMQHAIVGFAAILWQENTCELIQIVIASAFRQRGLATRLLHHILKQMKQCQIEKMFLEVRASNRAARACYLQFGFKEDGVRRHYYPAQHGREDAILMSLQNR